MTDVQATKSDIKLSTVGKRDKCSELLTIRNDALKDKQIELKNNLKAEIESIRVDLMKVLGQPVDNNIQNLLVALNSMNEPTETELKGVILGTNKSYLTYRAVVDTANKVAGTILFHGVTIDEMLDELNKLSSLVLNTLDAGVFDPYPVVSYNYRLFDADKGIVQELNDVLESFIKGQFINFISTDPAIKNAGNVVLDDAAE